MARSREFRRRAGVAQGRPLFPLLFLFVAEALNLLESEAILPNLKGIKVGRTEYKLSQFVDDTIIFL